MNRGFTLIEIIIVVTILAIISIIAMRAVIGQQPKARDTKRLADIDFVQNYVERYYTEENSYPTTLTFDQLMQDFATRYLARFSEIRDPGQLRYTYSPSPTGTGFCLCAELEQPHKANSAANCTFPGTTHYCRVNIQ